MNDDDRDRHSKPLPYKSSKGRTRSYIKDADLQIQIPHREMTRMENAEIFKRLYAHYSKKDRAGKNEADAPDVVAEVQSEMENAKNTYDMMMDISNSIAEAYKELKKLQ